MQDTKLRNILEIAAVVVVFVVFVLSLSKPILDPDVFWHLKTGEWVWQNKSLPEQDPFGFTGDSSQDTIRKEFLLKQYWLGQLILFFFYQLSGFYGVIALRCILYLGIGLIIYLWLGKFGINRLIRLIFLLPVFYYSIRLLGDRPNNMSFLFAVLVVYLLESLRAKNSEFRTKDYTLLPLTMLLWANIHGGYVLGVAIIIIYLFPLIFELVYMKIKGKGLSVYNPVGFFSICLIAVIASSINPNAFNVIHVITEIIKGEGTVLTSTEFLSPLYYAKMGKYRYLLYVGAVILPFLLGVKKMKDIKHRFDSVSVTRMLLIIFLTVLSLKSIRFIPFLIFVSIPFISEYWGCSLSRVLQKTERFYMPAIFIFCLMIFLGVKNAKNTILMNEVISPIYPDGIVKFIKTEKPDGEIFNDLSFGGYLIWALYPDYKVFIDGRAMFRSVYLSYVKAISGLSEEISGVPVWKAIFNAYRINAVIIVGTNYISGEFTRLVRRLATDDEWSLVLMDKNALFFIRKTEKNIRIIKRYSIPKDLAYGVALKQAEMARLQFPNSWKVYVSLGEILLYMNRPQAAMLYFEAALRLNPLLRSTALANLVEELKSGRDYNRLLNQIFG